MILTITLIFFLFGLIIGSFLNVVILRFGTSRNLGGRSGCMVCGRNLSWHELFPVASFFVLKGRCRTCKTKISWQYPIVEFVSGVLFALLFLKFKPLFFLDSISFAMTYAYYAVAFSLLLVISVYDIRHKIIPNILSLVFGVLAFVGMFLFGDMGLALHIPSASSVLAGFVISIPFALLWLVSRGSWMGFGDAKLAVGLGFFLGMAQVINATVLAFWVGALVGLFLVFLDRIKGVKSEIPFAPFLVIGTILAFFFNFNLFPFF